MASYIQNIRKRNGDIVPFISQKITDAIRKANLESIDDTFTAKELERLTNEVTEAITAQDIPTVEFIQDTVEKVLIRNNFASTAKAYIIYRAEHTKIREAQGNLMDIYNELTFKKSADADIKRENANIDADTAMGTMLKYGSEGSKYYIDNYILPKDIAAAHIDGDIHIHDKDFYMLTETCCQIDLLKLFKDGFSTGHGYLREPNGIRSYAALGCIAIQANQNEMHGGQSIPNFDYSMAPGVAKTFAKEYFRALTAFFIAVLSMNSNDAKLLAKEIQRCIPMGIRLGNTDEYLHHLVDFLPYHQQSHNYQAISPNQTERA
ncbi:MAG: anaerobic ribonucleoside triphosphate reductase, partial [Anaerovibrio sp.]|nr:anaerobic ribonucleoside triphosphate reductase [Anaerovibrio sp.]